MLILDLLGTFVFAISGAAEGVKHPSCVSSCGWLRFAEAGAFPPGTRRRFPTRDNTILTRRPCTANNGSMLFASGVGGSSEPIPELPRESYLGFPCTKCRAAVRVFAFPAEMPSPYVILSGEIRLRCALCGHIDVYRSRSIKRYDDPH